MILRSLFVALLWSQVSYAVTGATLLSDLRFRLGQTSSSNSNFTDAQLYRCLNMAQDYVVSLGRVIEKLDTLGGGSLRISTPSLFITLRDNGYLWRNGAEVKPIPRVSTDSLAKVMDRMNSQSFGVDKYVISEEGGKLVVAPTLRAEDSFVVSYYAYADTVDSASECDFPPEWEEVLRLAAKVIALEKISSPDLMPAIQERDKLVAALYRSRTLKPQLAETGQ